MSNDLPADAPDASGDGADPGAKRSAMERMLDVIERTGDKVPHPAVIFLALCGIVIALSALFAAMDVQVTQQVAKPEPVPAEPHYEGGSHETYYDVAEDQSDDVDYEIVTETTRIESLLSGDGLRFLFTSPVANFNNFGVVGVILVAMVGVGVAEESGLIGALIRKLVAVAPDFSITYIIVLLGILSSIASDAGYLVLIPLGAAAFLSLGRHPLAGLGGAYAAVSAAFGVNVLIVPFDGVVTEITNEAAALVDPDRTIDLTSNFFFGVGSTIMLTVVIGLVTQRIVEKRLGPYEDVPDVEEVTHDPESDAKGLKAAKWATLAAVAGIALLVAPSWGPLRNPDTGSIVNDSPFMGSLIVLITLIFLVAGMAYGRGAGTLRGSVDIIGAITKTFASLSGLIFLLLIIAQFIAYFNYSNMATVAAVKMADVLKTADVGALWLLVGFILVTFVLNIIIPGIMPKWAIFAPVFVPLFLQLGVAPQTVLAAYRVGDSPTNVITPLMVYLPFIVTVAQKYKKDAGVGTIVSLMLPYTAVVAVAWTLFYAAWYLLGIPWGPGAPVHL